MPSKCNIQTLNIRKAFRTAQRKAYVAAALLRDPVPSIADIAREMGLTRQRIGAIRDQLIDEANASAQSDIATWRQLQNDRIELQYAAVENVVTDAETPPEPQVGKYALDILKRQADLLGLDKPVKQVFEVSTTAEKGIEALTDAMAECSVAPDLFDAIMAKYVEKIGGPSAHVGPLA